MDQKFFEDKISGLPSCPKTIQAVFEDRVDSIKEYERATGKSLDDVLSKDDYIQLLNSCGIRRSSYFKQCKMAIMRYIRYQIAAGVLPAEQEQVFKSVSMDDLSVDGGKGVQYFKNLAELRKCIEDTVHSAMNYDETLYDCPISALYLAWFGFTDRQMLELRKDDVLEDGVMLDGKLVAIPSFAMQIITRYRDADGYYQQARGVIFRRYQYSDYLFRTERSYRMSLPQFKASIVRFNDIMDQTYSLQYTSVHLSGIFNRAYAMECESTSFNLDDPAFASEVFGEPLADLKLKHMVSDYKHYKKLFH